MRVFSLFLRLQWYFGHFKSFGVVVVVLGAFLSFSRILGYFGHSWCILIILAVLRGSF